ncbi:hypothetical protein BJ912DRAFT_889223 [Pholiota molesta]|nr:hypothetical protein BJ912DRAFT_889223 [Pholiota molesta]
MDQDVRGARSEVEGVIESALRMEKEYGGMRQHEEERWDPFSEGQYKELRYFSAEKEMYRPLTIMFEYIDSFSDSCALPKRSFVPKDAVILEADPHAQGFPKGTPDFILLEHPSTSTSTSNSPPPASGHQWQRLALGRHTAGFCLVRPSPHHGPQYPPTQGPNPKRVTSLVRQAAEYARMHLSARPLLLLSVALLVFGSQFCVAIFDRASAQFSPIHDIWADTRMFVRVMRSLTCLLSDVELGHDSGERDGDPSRGSFPTYMITMDGRTWHTLGPPVWTSMSFFGRGTSMWLVRENGVGPVFVLRNTWGRASRMSEAGVYAAIQGGHPGLAKFCTAEDVCFPGGRRCITAHTLRGADLDVDGAHSAGKDDVVLHRVLFETRGRPLWEYRSEKELLSGILAALSAHQLLCEQGIVHRDVNPGNSMLSAETMPDTGADGFLLDLACASVASASAGIVEAAVPKIMDSATHGAAWSGTAPFMAADILKAIVMNAPIKHEPKHDIESIIHVLGYALTRLADPPACLHHDALAVTRPRHHATPTQGRADASMAHMN